MTFDGLQFIQPDWPAPDNIRAFSTTRQGGVSEAPFDSLNLADRVGDKGKRVDENRKRLKKALELPEKPLWLKQVHGTNVAKTGRDKPGVEADAVFGRSGVIAIQTADCLPVLLCTRGGKKIAGAHAGWRGLAAGVLERTVGAIQSEPEKMLAWLGPAIGPSAFEVGDEVRDLFVSRSKKAASAFTDAGSEGKWLADIYQLARLRLKAAGVEDVYGGEFCTYSDAERFFSYRRDGETGRMASLIWRE